MINNEYVLFIIPNHVTLFYTILFEMYHNYIASRFLLYGLSNSVIILRTIMSNYNPYERLLKSILSLGLHS